MPFAPGNGGETTPYSPKLGRAQALQAPSLESVEPQAARGCGRQEDPPEVQCHAPGQHQEPWGYPQGLRNFSLAHAWKTQDQAPGALPVRLDLSLLPHSLHEGEGRS